MRALQLQAPGQLKTIHMAEPPAPRDGQVLLRIQRVGLCGTDLSSYRGKNPLFAYPRIPGHEIAATIEALSETVGPEWHTGQPVAVMPQANCGRCTACRAQRPNACRDNQTYGVQRDGGLVEYLLAPAHKLLAGDGLDAATLALVEPFSIGFHAVSRGRIVAGERVAILGCGGVGLGAIAAALARGAEVLAVDVDQEKLRRCQQMGARHAVPAGDAAREQLLDLTRGEGPDVVIEAAGRADTYALALETAAFAGRVVCIGYAPGLAPLETRYFVQKELDWLGARNALPEDFAAALQWLRANPRRVPEIVTHTVTMEQTPQILAAWSQTPAAFGKIQVAIGDANS